MDIAELQQLAGFSEFERQAQALAPALDAVRTYERQMRDLVPSADPYVSELEKLEAARAALTGGGLDRAREAIGLKYFDRVTNRFGLAGLDGAWRQLESLLEAQQRLEALANPRLDALEILQRQMGLAVQRWGTPGAWFSRGDVDLTWVVGRVSYWDLIAGGRQRTVAADVARLAAASFFGARAGPPKPRKFEVTRVLRSALNRQLRAAVCFVQSLQTFLMRRNLFGDRFGLSIEVARG
jgi:hypothetical protein